MTQTQAAVAQFWAGSAGYIRLKRDKYGYFIGAHIKDALTLHNLIRRSSFHADEYDTILLRLSDRGYGLDVV